MNHIESLTPEEQVVFSEAHAYLNEKGKTTPLRQAMSIIYGALQVQLQEATAENQRLKAELWDAERSHSKGAL